MSKVSGSIRFNTDSSKLEIYNGEAWWNIDSTSPEEQTGGTRGLIMGGLSAGHPNGDNVMQFITISTTGDATDFGDLTFSTNNGKLNAMSCLPSATRVVMPGGDTFSSGSVNTIEYVEISTTGNTSDFGDLNFKGYRGASCSSNIRAVIIQGSKDNGQPQNSIDFITIATTGNATDFGDKTTSTGEMSESGTSNGHGGL